MSDGALIHGETDVAGSAMAAAEASERAFRAEETVPLRHDRGEAEIAEESPTATDQDAEAVEVGGEVRPFASEETVPLRDDRERQEAEERDARLALILAPRRRLRRW